MSNYRFLDYDGTIIKNTECFLNQYERAYFYQNNMIIENYEIMPLFSEENLENKHIATILKWKIGTFNNPEEKDGDFLIKSRSGKISVNAIKNTLNKYDSKEIKDTKKAKELFNTLIEIPNIGRVYAVTIMHFFSKGYYPIFDQFAELALEMILNNDMQIWGRVGKPKELTSWKAYEDYIFKLHLIFGDTWRNDYNEYRRIDRALWSYGHMFEKK